MSFSGTLARKGCAVTFSKSTPGTYDGNTDTYSPPSAVTVTGYAMQIEGDPETYARLGLIQSENPTLLFKPTIVGVLPGLGFTVPWGDETLTVKDVEPLAMNGTKTGARIRVSR